MSKTLVAIRDLQGAWGIGMNKLLTAFASAAFATLCAASLVAMPAAAADFQQPYGKLLPSPVLTPSIWNGLYIGGMAGYGWSGSVPLAGFTNLNHDLKGGFLGGTIGYNWQAPNSKIVWGTEVDGAWSDAHFGTNGPLGDFQDRLGAFGSITGRLGWAAGTALVYIKGGLGWADNKALASTLPPLVGVQQGSKAYVGWTIGTGLEYMFAPAWSAKVEYMYADYGNKTYFNNILNIGITTHTVKTGLDYHFNWGGPVVTRY